MRFTVRGRFDTPLRLTEFPAIVLTRDNWDDYGLRTTFSADLHLGESELVELGLVKILERGQSVGATQLPDQFDELSDAYVSLGQAFSYYEQLVRHEPAVYEPLLAALRDAVYIPPLRDAFSMERGWSESLLRFDAAERALIDGPVLFHVYQQGTQRGIESFQYELPDNGATTTFSFGDVSELPNRLNVVIGYNGAGKTRLLANLAMLAYEDSQQAAQPGFIEQYGQYVSPRPSFGAIIAISYSAFDSFAIPGAGTSTSDMLERERIGRGEKSARGYTYCGLRQVAEDGTIQTALKSIDELTAEFHGARKRVIEMDRTDSLRAATEPIYREPSFSTIAELPDVAAAETHWRLAFDRLSTGHKIVLNIVVQLCANLEHRSMVLFDEPELHLHPPLLAALLQATGVALERHDSFAIVATHSPVVLQEVPARNVKVLRRSQDDVAVEAPEIETFAENIGILTSHVFSLDSSSTDFQGVLRNLALELDTEEIERLFDGPMSSQARSLVMSIKRLTD